MKRNLPKYVYPKGKKGYLYFTRNGRTTRMVEQPGTDAFFLEYARLLNGAPPVPRGKTWQSLIAAYKSSPKYTEKAKRTRSDYDKILSFIIDKMGQMDPVKMRRKDVIRIRDANAETKRFANYCVQIIGILQEYAIDIGWRDEGTNPAKGVSLLKSESTREPWPQEMVEAYRAKATGRALLLFELMIGTGQRIGDVLQMQWGMIENDAIVLRQNKTGKSLYIPFTHRLRSLLAETPREALFIVPGKDGKPLSYRAAAQAVMRVRKAIGAERWDNHALRYTAATELLLAGCSDEQIAAITGQSPEMVRYYTRQTRQKVHALEAQKRRT